MPIDAGSLHYAVGPAIAGVMLLVLSFFLRWAFASNTPKATKRPSADDGLLTRVATLSKRESALALRAVLSDAGIRSTVRFPAPHRADVLVFPEDAGQARVLASSFTN